MPIILSALLASALAAAPGVAGMWVLKAGDQAIFRLDIHETPTGTTATWERPEHFQTDGDTFSHVAGPVARRQARSVRIVDGDIELRFDDPAPGDVPVTFRVHRVDPDRLDVTLEGTGLEPFQFVRAQATASPFGGWDANQSYVRTIARPTNAEMTAIFDADQEDRRATNVNRSVVGPADAKRRARTQDLLDSGALESGDDFFHAAFVFQHGNAPADYLKAHLLAMIAIARGKPGAVWIAAASLDRYLQAIGKPQVLGTQYTLLKDAPATQEPYDRTLVSDAMRKALHVPSIAEQEEQRRQYAKPASSPTKP